MPGTRLRRLLVLLAAGAAALLPSPARAHVVTTVDGTVYEGKVLLENEEKVVIATTFGGEVSIPRAEVKSVDRTVPPLRDQLEFRAGRAKDDVEQLWDLHRWAKEKGFQGELTEILGRILVLDPAAACGPTSSSGTRRSTGGG